VLFGAEDKDPCPTSGKDFVKLPGFAGQQQLCGTSSVTLDRRLSRAENLRCAISTP
jgi:hypothetical protein